MHVTRDEYIKCVIIIHALYVQYVYIQGIRIGSESGVEIVAWIWFRSKIPILSNWHFRKF